MVRLTTCALAVSLWASGAARATPRTVALREAIDLARKHHPSLATARARIDVARARTEVARAGRYPQVVLGAELMLASRNNTTASTGGPLGFDLVRIGGTPVEDPISLAPLPSTLVGAGVRQPLYDFGRIGRQVEALELFARATEETASAADQDLVLVVEHSFYAVQGARAIQTAAAAAVERARRHREFAKANVEAQLRAPIELTRADADLARREVEFARATGALDAAQQILAAAAGVPEVALDAGTDDLAFAAPTDTASNPTIRAATLQVQAQQATTRALAAERFPELQFVAGASLRDGAWLPDVPNWHAMVVLRAPVFDRTITTQIEASRRMERVRAGELAVEREALRVRIAQARNELGVAEQTLPPLQRALDAATANQAQAEARFARGLGTAVELADAEALLTDAEIQLAVGRFQLARTRARLARELGEVTP